MLIQSIKRGLVTNLKNVPGWSTNRKIVVFISDDWGDLRIYSKEEYERLLSQGVPVDRSAHTRIEGVASHYDLLRLFEVLNSVKDKNGKPAVLSPFMIMANPDFDKIEEVSFARYFFKPFTDTLSEQPDGIKTLHAWMDGISEGIFLPELHGREHVNVPVWMRRLQSGDETYRFCFNNRFAHYTSPDMKVPIVATYFYEKEEDFQYIDDSLAEGIRLFESVFKKKPVVFNPPNAIFHPRYYRTLISDGVKNIDSSHWRMEPDGTGNIKKRRYKFGAISREGVVHFISNCAFEPVNNNSNVIGNTLKQIAAAFRWGKPALINTHRINFVTGRNSNHVDRCLKDFSNLLKSIIKRWPEAEFMGAGEFGHFMNSTLVND